MKLNRQVHFTFIALATLLIQTFAFAQAPTAKGQNKHCFWKVEGKGNTIYLLGSIHVLNKKFYPLDKPIEDAFKNSQMLVLEADLAEMESTQTQMKMLMAGKYPEGESLQKNLTKETYTRLDNMLKESGLSAAAFDALRPWMVTVVIMASELQKLGFNPNEGVDKYFYDKAKADGKKVRGLETADFQLSIFKEFTPPEEEAMLKETFDEIHNLKKDMAELTTAWSKGDTTGLEKLVLDMVKAYPNIYKKMILQRNQSWSTQMDKLATSGQNAFVVVGTAHLVGKDSLLELLKKKGFTVNQL